MFVKFDEWCCKFVGVYVGVVYMFVMNVVSIVFKFCFVDIGYLCVLCYVCWFIVDDVGCFEIEMGFGVFYVLVVYEINWWYVVGEWKYLVKVIDWYKLIVVWEFVVWIVKFVVEGKIIDDVLEMYL